MTNPSRSDALLPRVPDSVQGMVARGLYDDIVVTRRMLQDIARDLDAMRRSPVVRNAKELDNDVIANITLAYRHLEDTSMRLGCTLRALDGGTTADATAIGASNIATPSNIPSNNVIEYRAVVEGMDMGEPLTPYQHPHAGGGEPCWCGETHR